jgi:eight-cysteine-cluster-containing protein
MTTKRLTHLFVCIFASSALLLAACGGEPSENGEERTDPQLVGGKADIPSWLVHIPTDWGCDETLSGYFKGYDSAHLYSFPGKVGYAYLFELEGTWPGWKGAAIAVYDAETGERVAFERNRWSNSASVKYTAEKSIKYLVAVYTVAWWATGSYTLSATCELLTPTQCETQGGYCAHFLDTCKQGYVGGAPMDCPLGKSGQCCLPATQTQCETQGGYCAHFLDTCKQGYVGGAPMDCPLGKSGQCCLPAVKVTTDKTAYGTMDQVAASLKNGTADSIFLPGCSVFSWEKKEGTGWVNQGPDKVCFWEGYAVELKAGATFDENLMPKGAGTYRLVASYSVGCTPGLPLSQASCSGSFTATSPELVVKDCPLLAMPNPDTFCPADALVDEYQLVPKYDADGICIVGYTCQPVCKKSGCSGQVCAAKSMYTTCEWLPHYACYKLSTCGNFGTDGACAWEQTADFLSCMASQGM